MLWAFSAHIYIAARYLESQRGFAQPSNLSLWGVFPDILKVIWRVSESSFAAERSARRLLALVNFKLCCS